MLQSIGLRLVGQLISNVPRRSMRIFRERTVRAMYWRGRSFDRVKYAPTRRDELLEWNYKSEIYAFSRRLQENMSEDTLRKVMTHPDYVKKLLEKQKQFNLPSQDIEANDQLVSRGNKLLDNCIKPYLRCHLKQVPEDGIIAINNYLKSEPVLADMAQWFGCNDLILTTEYPPDESTKAATVLALVAGIEQDLGLDRMRRFVVDMMISYLHQKEILDDVWIIPNPRETLNLILVNSQCSIYEPRIVFQTGIKTLEACHVVGLFTNQKFLASSPGETLEIAEDCAALIALQRLFGLTDDRQPFTYGDKANSIAYDSHMKEHEYLRHWRFNIE